MSTVTGRRALPGLKALLANFAIAALAASALAGCGHVLGTIDLVGGRDRPETCRSTLGGYSLPTGLLRIQATITEANPRPAKVNVATSSQIVADRRQVFCLDFLNSQTSDDEIDVKSTNGLLDSISSTVNDKTPQIAQTLIKALETGVVAGAPVREAPLDAARPGEGADLTIDPFDRDDVLQAMAGLRRFGVCFYIEGQTFDISGLNAIGIAEAGRRWCQSPTSVRPPPAVVAEPLVSDRRKHGVFYRPLRTFKLVILQKRDPTKPGDWDWAIAQTVRIEMPNLSPVLVMDVDRALFATRKTNVSFKNGSLTDITIDKTSELAGFVGIPLYAAKAIASIPGQVIQAQISAANNQQAVLNAQADLINALATYKTTTGSTAPPAGVTPPRSAFLDSLCADAGVPPASCRAGQ